MNEDLGFVASDDLGFVPHDKTPSDPQTEALARAFKKSSQAGIFPAERIGEGSQGAAAFAQGALDSILAGAPEAIAKLSGVSDNTSASPKFTDPYAYSRGEIIGSLLPAGRILGAGRKAATTGGKLLLSGIEGLRMGAVYGGGRGVTDEIKQSGDQTELGQALETGGKGAVAGGAIGAALGAGIPAAFALAGKPKPTADQFITATLNPSKEFEKQNWWNDWGSASKDIKETGIPFKNLEEFGQAVQATQDRLGKEIQNAYAASPVKDIDGSKAVQAVQELISSRSRLMRENPEMASALLQKAEKYNGPIDKYEAQSLVTEINNDLISFYKTHGLTRKQALANPEIAADNAIARTLAGQLDDIIGAETGDKTLRQRYGNVLAVNRHIQDAAEEIPISEAKEAVKRFQAPNKLVEGLRNTGNLQFGDLLFKRPSLTPLESANYNLKQANNIMNPSLLGSLMQSPEIQKIAQDIAFQSILRNGLKLNSDQ